MKEVVMIVPVDRNVDVTEDVAQKNRPQTTEAFETSPVRWIHVEHHDCYQDGYHAVGKCGEPAAIHLSLRNFLEGHFPFTVVRIDSTNVTSLAPQRLVDRLEIVFPAIGTVGQPEGRFEMISPQP